MKNKTAKPRFSWKPPKLSLLQSTGTKTAILFAALTLLGIWIAVADLSPDLEHLDNQVLSGHTQGHYHRIVGHLEQGARVMHGALRNVPSAGSEENLDRLIAAAESGKCDVQFALVQDGLDWPESEVIQLVGRLYKLESVFFVGREAGGIRRFSELAGKTIGIGPEGSGSARIARQIFESRDFRGLGVTLVTHSIEDQLEALQSGSLELGIFVIDEDSTLIDELVRVRRLQLASFEHVDAIARRFPFALKGRIGAGQFDPVRLIPTTDRYVLRVATLIVTNGCADRSQVMGLMTLVEREFPGFVRHNRDTPNTTGLRLDPAADAFFAGEGADALDRYFPWLGDIMPPSNWLHIIMAVSILFNIMGFWHRFRLWRIDANRVKAELFIPVIFGEGATADEIEHEIPEARHLQPEQQERLDELIRRLEVLLARCRRQSLSILVPMGAEMAHRYQESMMERVLIHLRAFRAKLQEKVERE